MLSRTGSEYAVSNVPRGMSEAIQGSGTDYQHGLSDGSPPLGPGWVKVLLHMINRANDVLVLLPERAMG